MPGKVTCLFTKLWLIHSEELAVLFWIYRKKNYRAAALVELYQKKVSQTFRCAGAPQDNRKHSLISIMPVLCEAGME